MGGHSNLLLAAEARPRARPEEDSGLWRVALPEAAVAHAGPPFKSCQWLLVVRTAVIKTKWVRPSDTRAVHR